MNTPIVDIPDLEELISEGLEAPQGPGIYVPDPKLRYRDAGAAYRRQKTIHAYIGPNGHGKTLGMVHDTLSSLAHGRKVLSTVKLLDAKTGEAHPNYERLTSWDQMLEAEHCDVLFDEVLGIANSRTSQGMPVQVTVLLNQLRRRDIVLRWSAPAWNRADVIIRECTQAVTVSRGFFPKDLPGQGRAEIKAWRARRLFRWTTYSAIDFATWTDAKESKLEAEKRAWFWGPHSEAFASYNTLDSVERIGEVLDAGTCAHCGGSRPRKRCKCDDHDHE